MDFGGSEGTEMFRMDKGKVTPHKSRKGMTKTYGLLNIAYLRVTRKSVYLVLLH